MKKLRPTRTRDKKMIQNQSLIMRISFFFLFYFSFLFSTEAQGIVYFFGKSLPNVECYLSFNGKQLGELRGPVKRYLPNLHGGTPIPMYSACSKKCVLREAEKAVLVTKFKFTNSVNQEELITSAEIQIDFSDGQVHYVELTNKGLNDIQFKELSEKKGKNC